MIRTLLFQVFIVSALLSVSSCGEDAKKPTDSGNGETPLPLTFVSIPGGTFLMGDEAKNLGDDCRPVHSVTLSPYAMSVHEITSAQYAAYLNEASASDAVEEMFGSVYGKSGPWSGYCYLEFGRQSTTENQCWITRDGDTFSVARGKENRPVVLVTWYGASAFAEHYGYSLPTEAEWEYACRGGTQNNYGTGDGAMGIGKANYIDEGIGHPVAGGSYPPNLYGLCDMSGNVGEWCHDWYAEYPSESTINPSGAQNGVSRMVRGGSWNSYDTYCHAAIRENLRPENRNDCTGFRVVRRTGTHRL